MQIIYVNKIVVQLDKIIFVLFLVLFKFFRNENIANEDQLILFTVCHFFNFFLKFLFVNFLQRGSRNEELCYRDFEWQNFQGLKFENNFLVMKNI